MKSSVFHCCTVTWFTRCNTSPSCTAVAACEFGTAPRTLRACMVECRHGRVTHEDCTIVSLRLSGNALIGAMPSAVVKRMNKCCVEDIGCGHCLSATQAFSPMYGTCIPLANMMPNGSAVKVTDSRCDRAPLLFSDVLADGTPADGVKCTVTCGSTYHGVSGLIAVVTTGTSHHQSVYRTLQWTKPTNACIAGTVYAGLKWTTWQCAPHSGG